MLRNWVVCPTCQTNRGWKGHGENLEKVSFFTFVLGEILEDGSVLIKKGGNRTRIQGSDFSIICDYCGETVFVRDRKEVLNGKDSDQWQLRVHRTTFVGTIQGSIQA